MTKLRYVNKNVQKYHSRNVNKKKAWETCQKVVSQKTQQKYQKELGLKKNPLKYRLFDGTWCH